MRIDALFDPGLPEAARSWTTQPDALAGWCRALDCTPDEIAVSLDPENGGWTVHFLRPIELDPIPVPGAPRAAR